MKKLLTTVISCVLLHSILAHAGASESAAPNPYGKWNMGPSPDSGFFPIAVWLQNPQKAKAYRDAGINTYVALWNGPTEEHLAILKKADMKLICHLNEVARKHLDDPVIIGWMHGDEPDNAQSLGEGKGYGPPIPPSTIQEDYQKLRQADPRRPVMLNLGQGVAWDRWYGRGVRTNHPEDYSEYIKGSDIVSFDIYPVASSDAEISNNLWYVAKGVERLNQWSAGNKVVWNCIECTRIQNRDKKATPHQVRCEVWMSLIHGSKGLIYFVHEWEPKFNEAAILSDPEMLQAIKTINNQIHRLAPVLNAPAQAGSARVSTSNTNVPVALSCKTFKGQTYVFSVAMRNGSTTATFELANSKGSRLVEVIDENRTIRCENGVFKDSFAPWDVHLYRISNE